MLNKQYEWQDGRVWNVKKGTEECSVSSMNSQDERVNVKNFKKISVSVMTINSTNWKLFFFHVYSIHLFKKNKNRNI